MNGCASVRSRCACAHACLSHWEAWNTKAAASLLSSALTTLLVIRMTFENILTEDKRLNTEWVDLSTAKLQLEGWESTLETMWIEALGICNLPISSCSVLALAFQGESWNNQGALICGLKKTTDVVQHHSDFVFTLAAVAAALPQITTCPLNRGPASGCYSGTASSPPVWWYFSAAVFCAVLPTEISVVPSWVALTECSDCLHKEFIIFNVWI